ncbi:2-(3-amino-3-carboxypropyl)histidine synthase subunit 2 [Camellia lanceoleosa]|uniref:2-(3-amino-3-carboxypropyl)histidine synthase subunit 2 n=1 Tax=Camellia lanceoleosa TaxID=1840588 RepID=A0ACC0F2P9_9ERIC|nr:2-(3-amino-3-carboxypropyl)histidine synthase subunit 2 [Camellia lanceoleosa]
MGKLKPAKLVNFLECDVFVYVSFAQTALLDSKEFLSPVITPFEAMIAFSKYCQKIPLFISGYVEDFELEETSEENEDGTLALVKAIEKALQVSNKDPKSIIKGTAKSGTEYLASRSYHSLDIQSNSSLMFHTLISILFILVQFLLSYCF